MYTIVHDLPLKKNFIVSQDEQQDIEAEEIKDERQQLKNQFPGLSLPNKNKEEIDLDLDFNAI